jgi:hypothetical protein
MGDSFTPWEILLRHERFFYAVGDSLAPWEILLRRGRFFYAVGDSFTPCDGRFSCALRLEPRRSSREPDRRVARLEVRRFGPGAENCLQRRFFRDVRRPSRERFRAGCGIGRLGSKLRPLVRGWRGGVAGTAPSASRLDSYIGRITEGRLRYSSMNAIGYACFVCYRAGDAGKGR